MSRSIPELNLYNQDEDKEYYLSLMKTASRVYRVTIIAYCLMDSHVHLLVHPNGGNIGTFMKGINNPYARYYNRTYGRRGHLIGERFKNIVIEDEVQLLRTSTYIHNNAKDLLWKGHKSIEDYPYSSIRDFITPNQGRGIADPSLVFDYMNGEDAKVRNHYKVLLEIQSQGHEAFEKEVEEAFSKGRYVTDKKPVVRGADPKKVLGALAKLLDKSASELPLVKYRRSEKAYKALAAISLRIFCDMTLKDLTEIFKGYTSSGIGYLSTEGYKELMKDGLYCRLRDALTE